ncbi:hypothetical protein AVEN_13556-1 [Araneus ventricosus]|uniref:Uncharacterized protein n=1 Tax=Araneus ventricosus TaxID=182803 RepID=A0A4Y2D5E1_ARAVE|nr:hypothetical protein AVEN_13556-1 [Araneus ventricosus]
MFLFNNRHRLIKGIFYINVQVERDAIEERQKNFVNLKHAQMMMSQSIRLFKFSSTNICSLTDPTQYRACADGESSMEAKLEPAVPHHGAETSSYSGLH